MTSSNKIRAGAHRSYLNVRNLTRLVETYDCNLSQLMFVTGTNNDKLLQQTSFEQLFGQSEFAFQRGKQFEKMLSHNDYETYRTHLKLTDPPDFVAIDVRAFFPKNRTALTYRAKATKAHITSCLDGTYAFDLLEGAVFSFDTGHEVAYFEADSIVHKDGKLHICEVKSFPCVDGKLNAKKLGDALDQAAVYILLTRNLVVSLGMDPACVSFEAFIVTPQNTSLHPTFNSVNVEKRCRRIKQVLESLPNTPQILSLVPDGVTFGPVADPSNTEDIRLQHLHQLADTVGTSYSPGCLAHCGNALFCRSRAFSNNETALLGPYMKRLLPGCNLTRAAALSEGASPLKTEEPLADLLHMVGKLYDELTTSNQ